MLESFLSFVLFDSAGNPGTVWDVIFGILDGCKPDVKCSDWWAMILL